MTMLNSLFLFDINGCVICRQHPRQDRLSVRNFKELETKEPKSLGCLEKKWSQSLSDITLSS
ncbi:hypothetical protein YC2023_122808 [Brassica napus]